MRELDEMVLNIVDSPEKFDNFINKYENFILKSASKISKKYISKNDDEWSIALAGFSKAIKEYDYKKGSFISFAELLIRRNIIDYYKKQNKYNSEIQVEWIEDAAIMEDNSHNLKLEIQSIAEVFKNYGFKFNNLIKSSPKAKKTKVACAKAVAYLLKNPILIEEMRNKKQLCVKIIKKNVGIPRKTLERHRKYIIAATEIMNGDYPYLSEYLGYIKEELEI